MKKYFVCSDIHSAYTPWMEALNNAGFNKNEYNHKIIICGDLFDRMDETLQCFDFVKELQQQDRLIYVRGNHEDLLVDCVDEIRTGHFPSSHHFSNGTIKTICQFCGQKERIIYDPTWREKICEIMQPVLDFINNNTVDYFEIGTHIFVHGWIPFAEDWQNGDWEQARWTNGMNAWDEGIRLEGKTIVCGHYHTSWGHHYIDHTSLEFPNKYSTNPEHRTADFSPFIHEGIIALDACTAFSHKINCVVLTEDMI